MYFFILRNNDILYVIVLLITFICCFQDRLSSIVTPNNFSDVTCSSLFPLRNTFKILSSSFIKISFWRVPDSITFVFSTFVTIWFERHHDWILFEQICKKIQLFLHSYLIQKMWRHQQKRDNCVNPSSRRRGKSLIKIKNNRGPSIEPWGTPYVTCNGSDSFDLHLSCWVLLLRLRGKPA